MDVFKEYASTYGFKNKQDHLKFKRACISWADRAEYFFKDPNDYDKPLKLYPSQKRVIYALQFGIDIKYPNYPPVKGSLVTAGRQLMGKSTACMAGAAAGMLDGKLKFGLFAHVEPKSLKLLAGIKYFLENSPFRYLKNPKMWSKKEIGLINHSSALTHAASSSIEGGSFHYGLIDEGGWMEDRVVLMHILPTFRKIGKHWVMLGTPKGMRGVFWVFHEDAKRDVKMGNSPRYQVIYMDPVEDGLLSLKELKEEIKQYKGWAHQEGLGQFISAEDLFFKESWIEYAMGNITKNGSVHRRCPYYNAWAKHDNSPHIIGIDFGLFHSKTVFAVCHKEGEVIYLDYMKTFDDENEYLPILRRLISDWVPYWKPRYVVPDGTGMGRTNTELIREALRRFPGSNVYDNYPKDKNKIGFIMGDPTTKKELFDSLQDLFERGLIALPSHMSSIRKTEPGYEMYELKRELLSLQYEIKTKTVSFGSTSSSVGTDRIIALALASYPFKTSVHRYTPPLLMHHGYITQFNEPYSYAEVSLLNPAMVYQQERNKQGWDYYI